MKFTELPAVGKPLAEGIFAGITSTKKGHFAVILRPEQGSNLTYRQAKAWAKKLGGELPTRPVAAMLFANLKKLLREEWHWTADTQGGSNAWVCYFISTQYDFHKRYKCSAVAVRLIQITE